MAVLTFFSLRTTVIQGSADVAGSKVTQEEISNTVDFCLQAFEYTDPEKTQKIQSALQNKTHIDPAELSEDENKILRIIRARQMLRFGDQLHIQNFGADAIDGYAPRVEKGNLTLVSTAPPVTTGEDEGFDFGAALLRKEAQEVIEEKVAAAQVAPEQPAVAVAVAVAVN